MKNIDEEVWSSLPQHIRDEITSTQGAGFVLDDDVDPVVQVAQARPPSSSLSAAGEDACGLGSKRNRKRRKSNESVFDAPYLDGLIKQGRLIIRYRDEGRTCAAAESATASYSAAQSGLGSSASCAIPLYSDDESAGESDGCDEAAGGFEGGFRLCLITQNLWFQNVHEKVRMEHLRDNYFSPSKKKNSDDSSSASSTPIVCCQELTGELMRHLSSPSYTIHDQQLRSGFTSGIGIDLQYGCAVLTDMSSSSYAVNFSGTFLFESSRMARGLTFISVSPRASSSRCPGVLIATTHLESWCGPGQTGATERSKQVREFKFFAEKLVSLGIVSYAVVCGDMNWDDERLPGSKRKLGDPDMMQILGGDWVDCWKLKGVGSGLTYDAKENQMLMGSLRRRFDRVLLYSPRSSNSSPPAVSSTTIIATKPIEGYYRKSPRNTMLPLLPSDHFGLKVDITF